MGLCPRETAQGDFLCVLLGCNLPVVLRRQDEHYVLIGEAYVPGYMQGEAMASIKEGKRQTKIFTIY